MSQQPYGSGQPGQPGGYQQPGQSQGNPQGGYPQPGQAQPGQPQGYPPAGYQSSPAPAPSSGFGGSSNPMNSASAFAPILQIIGIVVAVLGIIGGLFAFGIDGYPGSLKVVTFCGSVVAGLGFGAVLVGLSLLLKRAKA